MIKNTVCWASRPLTAHAGLCVCKIVHDTHGESLFCWLMPVRTTQPTVCPHETCSHSEQPNAGQGAS